MRIEGPHTLFLTLHLSIFSFASEKTRMKRTYPPAIFAIGRNYADHAAEMAYEPLEHPVVFMKNPPCVIGGDEPIVIPPICDHPEPQVDYEGELAVVIGETCRDINEGDALAHVAGYAVANDVSARWWQKHGSGGQYVRGKSFDTFCPISDVTPREAAPDPQHLTLVTKLNGEIVQQAHTKDMVFPVAKLIAELTRGMTLLENTVILTGTPAGVGAAQTPPRFLRDGDVVEVIIEGVGKIRNRIEHAIERR